ncbi:MAG: type II toxin-antitoxin system mRNA interferase toxin, RelE/StbE family [Pseudomonadota bacterium]
MNYTILYSEAAIRDIPKLKSAKLDGKTKALCESLSQNPIPSFSKQLVGSLRGKYSIRINLKHRLVYEILEDIKVVKILRLWSHYDDN